MRHRLFGFFFLFALAASALFACSSPFEAGKANALGGDDTDGQASTGGEVDPDGGTVVVGPPPTTLPDGAPAPRDATTDGSDAGEPGDATDRDADHDGAAVDDASDDTTLNPIDAALDAADASHEPPDTGPACPSNEKLCGGSCVSKTNPEFGCAAVSCTPCGFAHAGATCAGNGECALGACAAGYDNCDSQESTGCETPITTPSNCGGCNKACTASDPFCTAGGGSTYACSSGCSSNEQLCNSQCVNESTNVGDCGGCSSAQKSYACSAPTNGSPTCANSACGFACNNGFNECNGNECVSFNSDTKNCGACNHSCAAPVNGSATCNGTCGIACNAPYSPCNGACDDERSDVNNCGGCGHACSVPAHGAPTCAPVNGVGTCGFTCTSPYSICNGGCADEQTDVNNCGACAHACAVPAHGSATCNGTCGIACASPYSVCNGACADEQIDVNNCGACGHACTAPTHGSPTCAPVGGVGTCGFSCASPYTPCNGACDDEQTDVNNCGACGHACTVPAHGYATCNGTCGIACNSPYSVCNGVCDDEQTDVNNCGACNHVCPIPAHGGSTCAPVGGVGTCGITCTSPYSVCNAGCVDEQNDVNNCGACGHACTAPLNATPTCGSPTSGTCGFACNSGYQLCTTGCVRADPTAVFVSASSSATSGCGAIGSPCKTITAGISYAVANGKTLIYVDRGTYDEQITLANGLTIVGGWIYGGGSVWTKECGNVDWASLTVIAPTSSSIAVIAKDVTATLETLTIHNTKTATPGESLYGIFAASTGATMDTSLTLDAVEVTVAAGGAGTTGGLGGAPPLPANNVSPCTSRPGDGAAGTTPSAGAPTVATYASAGYFPGAGGAGGTGNAGDNGPAGATGSCVTDSKCVIDVCTAGTACGGKGAAGCGGSGGAPGLGGGGGGASIALFAWKATVEIGGSLAAGNGGNGGAGAVGASPGTAPTTGAQGSPAIVMTCTKNGASCTGGATTAPVGGAGTTGGAGSKGGNGAGGSGGDSYSYYTASGATVSYVGNPVLTFGTAGTSPAGTTYAGHAAAHN